VGAVVTAWVAYAVASAWWFGSSARAVAPYVYAPLLVVIGGWLGHRLARLTTPRTMATGLALLAAFFLGSVLLTSGPAKGPIGYANANAAVAVQLMALGGLLGLDPRARLLGWIALTSGLLTVLANRSAGGAAVALPVLLVSLYALHAVPGRRRWPAALLGLGALTATTVGLVSLARRPLWPSVAVEAFDEVRRLLWLQAWGAFREAETAGRGPGSFEALNILKDSDQSSAHSLPLQVAVELGGIGVALLVMVYLAGLAVALKAATPAHAWIAVAGWTALAVHAFVDHLVEYWPIPLAAGLVLGYGLVAQADPESEHEVV
jgi:hypothetical protein